MYNPGVHDQSGQFLARGIENSATIDAVGTQQLVQGIQGGIQGLAQGAAGFITAQQESAANKNLWEGIKSYYPGVVNEKQDQKFYTSGLSGQRAMITQANAFADMLIKQQQNAPTSWSPDPSTIATMQGQGYAWAPTSRGNGMWINTQLRERNDRPALVQQADGTFGLVDLQQGQFTPVVGPGGQAVKGMPKSSSMFDQLLAQTSAPQIQKLQGEIAALQQAIGSGKNNPWYSPGGVFGTYETQLAQKQAELQQLQGGMPSSAPVVFSQPSAPSMVSQQSAAANRAKALNAPAGKRFWQNGVLYEADGKGNFLPVK